MNRSRRLAALAASSALLLPGTALAQSAGDEQYKDPFPSGGSRGQELAQTSPSDSATPLSQQPPGGSSSGSNNSGSNSSSGSQSSKSKAQQSQAKPKSSDLPATGSEPGLVALMGCGLLLTGLGLRVRQPSA